MLYGDAPEGLGSHMCVWGGPRNDDGKVLQAVPTWGITSHVAPVGSSGFPLSGELALSLYFPLGLGFETL